MSVNGLRSIFKMVLVNWSAFVSYALLFAVFRRFPAVRDQNVQVAREQVQRHVARLLRIVRGEFLFFTVRDGRFGRQTGLISGIASGIPCRAYTGTSSFTTILAHL